MSISCYSIGVYDVLNSKIWRLCRKCILLSLRWIQPCKLLHFISTFHFHLTHSNIKWGSAIMLTRNSSPLNKFRSQRGLAFFVMCQSFGAISCEIRSFVNSRNISRFVSRFPISELTFCAGIINHKKFKKEQKTSSKISTKSDAELLGLEFLEAINYPLKFCKRWFAYIWFNDVLVWR